MVVRGIREEATGIMAKGEGNGDTWIAVGPRIY